MNSYPDLGLDEDTGRAVLRAGIAAVKAGGGTRSAGVALMEPVRSRLGLPKVTLDGIAVGVFGDPETKAEKAREPRRTFADILRSAPIRPKIKTGFPTLDRLTCGGMTVGKLTVVVGPPSAAKTAFVHHLARAAASQKIPVEILPADDGVETTAERLALLAGVPPEAVARRDPAAFAALDLMPMIYPPPKEESLQQFCHRVGASVDRPLVAIVDSAHAAAESCVGESERDRIKRAVELLKTLADTGPAVVASSESNRAFYASKDLAKRNDSMASGAETRKLEYSAGLLLVLENVGSSIRVEVRKNKCGGRTGELRLRLDPTSLGLAEIDLAEFEAEQARAAEKRLAEYCGKITACLEKEATDCKKASRPFKGLSGTKLDESGGNEKKIKLARQHMVAIGTLLEIDGERSGWHRYVLATQDAGE
jgi:archaellum biogenesis ATPase FlaH